MVVQEHARTIKNLARVIMRLDSALGQRISGAAFLLSRLHQPRSAPVLANPFRSRALDTMNRGSAPVTAQSSAASQLQNRLLLLRQPRSAPVLVSPPRSRARGITSRGNAPVTARSSAAFLPRLLLLRSALVPASPPRSRARGTMSRGNAPEIVQSSAV